MSKQMFLLPAQARLLRATGRIVAFIAGYGAGKTFSACLKALQLAARNPGCDGVFIEPTFKMCNMIAIPDMESACKDLNVEYRWIASKMLMQVWVGTEPEWTNIYFMSADKPDALDGLNLAWAIVDEAGQLKNDRVAKKCIARMRAPNAKLVMLVLVSTPEGGPGTWLGQWAEFGPPGIVANELIRAKTADNPYLKKEYLEEMKARYTPEEYKGYCEGFFVAAGGQVYRFDSTRNVRTQEVPTDFGEVQVYADFNVSKVVWLLAWVHQDVVYVFDEIVKQGVYTEEMAKETAIRLRKWGHNPHGVKIYHDANTGSRSATASRDRTGFSDVHYCKEVGLIPKAGRQNPPVRDRLAAVNAKLRDGTIQVDPRCTELIACLATQGRDANGQPDKAGGLDHAPDALGYGIYNQWRVRKIHDEHAPHRYA